MINTPLHCHTWMVTKHRQIISLFWVYDDIQTEIERLALDMAGGAASAEFSQTPRSSEVKTCREFSMISMAKDTHMNKPIAYYIDTLTGCACTFWISFSRAFLWFLSESIFGSPDFGCGCSAVELRGKAVHWAPFHGAVLFIHWSAFSMIFPIFHIWNGHFPWSSPNFQTPTGWHFQQDQHWFCRNIMAYQLFREAYQATR